LSNTDTEATNPAISPKIANINCINAALEVVFIKGVVAKVISLLLVQCLLKLRLN
jgi:hypothetical protein